jgi:glycerate dehydrogenase
MKIVLLDGYTLNPGDLSWAPLQALGKLKVYDRTGPDEIVPRAQHAEAVLTNRVALNRETIRHIVNLKYIGVLAAGHHAVNVEAAKKRGVVVTSVPGFATESVAQLAMAYLLEFAIGVSHHSQTVHKGRWARNPDFCYWSFPLRELAGQTLGIVGYGAIGRAVARRAGALGMKVRVHTRHPPPAEEGVEFVDLDRIFGESDAVSLHCPLTPETERLVNEYRLSQMRPQAILINTAAGGLVDEAALAAALNDRRIAGAALDVLTEEPPSPKHPLLHARNCLITPHQGWASVEARQRLVDGVAANLKAFQEGKPVNVVA